MKELIIATYKTYTEAYKAQNYTTKGMFRKNAKGLIEYVISVLEDDDPEECNCSSPDCEFKILVRLAEDANMFKINQ
jgi:hypothetical protein